MTARNEWAHGGRISLPYYSAFGLGPTYTLDTADASHCNGLSVALLTVKDFF
jgi:hypothetical protein